MNKKGYLDISFSWIFAIIVGIIFIFGAVYGVSKIIGVKDTEFSATSGTTLSNILGPLETSIEAGKSVRVTFPTDVRLETFCNSAGDFGSERVQTDGYRKGEYSDSGIQIDFENKYLFTQKMNEGKNFYAFSFLFEFPFKVANLIYLIPTDKNYCFQDAPTKIENDLSSLNQGNFFFEDCKNNLEMIQVCFLNSDSCDVKIDQNSKSVETNSGKVYYEEEALMYAAIFSDASIYECNVVRLMKRVRELADTYAKKGFFIQNTGCSSNVIADLVALKSQAEGIKSSSDLFSLRSDVDKIKSINRNSRCKLW